MGCDIHCCLEVKIDDTWHLYSQPSVSRDYRLFARMAGVRGSVAEAISSPRGLPDDMSAMTAALALYYGGDGHSHSYLTKEEISLLISELREQKTYYYGHVFGNLAGNSPTIEDQADSRDLFFSDWRLVFWFDN